MCRLFGFRSIIKSQVHSSLVTGNDSFMTCSRDHPDGWGLAYYMEGVPHLIKSDSKALNDELFTRVTGQLASATVVAHLRKATLGANDLVNTHPFQFGPWIFAHNGNIKSFSQHEERLVSLIDSEVLRVRMGRTDSEVIFLIFMTYLQKAHLLNAPEGSMGRIIDVIKQALSDMIAITGPFNLIDGPPEETYFTFLLTQGDNMIAFQGGKPLFVSTYKSLCSERDFCPSYGPSCEAPTKPGAVNHLVVSSQKLPGANIWQEMEAGEIVAVDETMTLHRFSILS